MSYFDYLEVAQDEKREFKAYDSLARVSMWTGIGGFALFLASVLVYCFGIGMGTNPYLTILSGGAMIVSIISAVLAIKAIVTARKTRNRSALGNCCAVWGVLFSLLSATLIVINLWMYFSQALA